LRDNYEDPLYTPALEGGEFELDQLDRVLRLSVDDFMAHARTLSSPDELSVYIAKRLMQQESPSLLWITMHDMDVAHSGAYSLYIDGIQRTDRLCGELWKVVQSEPEYKDNTTLFILPDFGRDADYDAGGNGFQHHRTGDAASRTTWMMALGKGVREGMIYDQPVQSIDLVPSLGAIMGFSAGISQGKPIAELL
jgi:arylsulfatase A-like enzyme